jgi:hypothetical protein
MDNGWRVKMGRGLVIYQPPESWFVAGAKDLALHPCLETIVDIHLFESGDFSWSLFIGRIEELRAWIKGRWSL